MQGKATVNEGRKAMPRVNPLNPIERKKNEMKKYIKGKLAENDMHQKDIGEALGMTQQAAGYKIRTGCYSLTDLWKIFRLLGSTDEEILKVMKM